MFKKILVPLDSSELAERALIPARQLAQKYDAELILLTVPELAPALSALVYTYDVPAFSDNADNDRAEAEQYLNHRLYAVRESGLRAHTVIQEGDPAEVILSVAEAEDVDLIIMSTHGYTGLDHWVMGSVAERVLQHAPCPVYVVRTRDPIKKVLITLDGSKLAEQALAPGMALAHGLKAETTLLRVKELAAQPELESVYHLDALEEGLGQSIMEDYYSTVDAYLEEKRDQLGKANVQETVALRGRHPAADIVEYVRDNDINLVVMATHGRTGLRRWLYGSVAQKVMRITPSAMLIVRPSAT